MIATPWIYGSKPEAPGAHFSALRPGVKGCSALPSVALDPMACAPGRPDMAPPGWIPFGWPALLDFKPFMPYPECMKKSQNGGTGMDRKARIHALMDELEKIAERPGSGFTKELDTVIIMAKLTAILTLTLELMAERYLKK